MKVRRLANDVLFFTSVFILQTVFGIVTKETWDYTVQLGNKEDYKLSWKVKDEKITFQLEVKTTGWIGFGLSPQGRLAGSDVIIAWMEEEVHLYDYHAKTDNTVTLDEDQNWKILSGKETKTQTIIQFTRPLILCSNEDRSITADTQRIIFAHHPEDPTSSISVPFSEVDWQTQSVKLLQPKMHKIQMPRDVFSWDIRAQNFTVPDDRRYFYYCQVFRAPVLKKKHHIIKITPVIRPRNIELVHHMVVFKCNSRTQEEGENAVRLGPGECTNPIFGICQVFWASWGLGGGSLIFPNQAGVPFGGTAQEYYMMNIHYEHIYFRKGLIDDSGMRFYLTPQLRQFDAATTLFEVNAHEYPVTVTPPGQKEFIVAGHGHPQCLAQGLPRDGIKIFGGLLHSHMIEKKMRLRHFRKNKELPPILSDSNYDFTYQEYIYFSENKIVLPGDQITVECNGDSRERAITTFTGLSSTDEMCAGFIFYYPAMSVNYAASSPKPELVAGLTGLELTTQDYTAFLHLNIPNPNFINHLMCYDWPDSNMCAIENSMRFSPHISFCRLFNGTTVNVPTSTYPKDMKEYIVPDPCVKKIREKLTMGQKTSFGSQCRLEEDRHRTMRRS